MNMPPFASQVLQRAQQAGAEADLIFDERETLSLSAREGALEEQSISATRILGLRVVQHQRVGIAYSEASDDAALQTLVEQALINAGFGQSETHERIPQYSRILTTDDQLLCPNNNLDMASRVELALYLERTLASKPHIRNVPYNGVKEQIQHRQIFSTQGLRASARQRSNSLYAYALAADGELTAMANSGDAARTGGQLNADKVIDQAHAEAVALLRGRAIASRRYDVIFARQAQQSLFSAFSLCWSGKSAKDGVNPWRDQLGRAVASPLLHISDQPLNTDGFGYHLFDAEGTACTETPLVVDGVLQTLLHNSATASYFAVLNTGHAQRGPKSPLSVGMHQLCIAAGQSSERDLTAGEYLEITDLQGVHSGANAISGDFSFGAAGFLCRNGERVQPVRGITVAGNFYQMLKHVTAVADLAHWNWQRTSLMPLLRFADVAISG